MSKQGRRPVSSKTIMRLILVVVASVFAVLTPLVFSGNGFEGGGNRDLIHGAAFTSGNPSREYVYAGARLISSEETQTCSPFLTKTSPRSFPAVPNPDSGSFSVSIGPSCSWTAASGASWITVLSGATGFENGTVTYRVAQNTTGLSRSGVITVSGQAGQSSFTVFQGPQFSDVPVSHIFYSFIGRLAARGVTLGCSSSPPAYCPDNVVLHQEMAAFVLRARGEFNPPTPAAQKFADVQPADLFYTFIDRMDALNIWNGCGTNQFGQRIYCPQNAVTREQMASIIIRGIGEFNPPQPSFQRFNDVSPSSQYYKFIDRMAALGITSGCLSNPPLYCPSDGVTRGQTAVFLVRAFDL